MTCPRYSVVIPTFRRAESLAECLASVCALDYPLSRLEVIVIDNGGAAEHTRSAAEPYLGRLDLRYLVNPVNRGYGFSVNRGIVESRGDRLLLLNDDARPRPDLLTRCDALLDGDASIGCVGCRAVEAGYEASPGGIGEMMTSGCVSGNFDVDCGAPIDVEHIYGFCYLFTRDAVRRAGLNDRTLLARPYSSGNRIETDHCLSIRRAGLRVVYHPGMVAEHLAKPRPDLEERSLGWHRNAIRNTLYVYLKHYGLFGKRGAALRLTFLRDLGLRSLLRRPTRENAAYFVMAMQARASAYWHAARHRLATPAVEDFRRLVDTDARLAAGLDDFGPSRRERHSGA